MILKTNTSPSQFVADDLNSLLQNTDNSTSFFNINPLTSSQKNDLLHFLSQFEYLDTRIHKVISSLKETELTSAAISIKLPPYSENTLSMKTFYIKNDVDEAQVTAMNRSALPEHLKNSASSYYFSFSHIGSDKQYKIDGHLFDSMEHHKELIDTLNNEGFGITE